jgi:hypothetical protein
VDDKDAQFFLAEYALVCRHQITGDLNRDGSPDGPDDGLFCRIDLTGDQKLHADDFAVLIGAWTGSDPEKKKAIAQFKALNCP